MNILPCETDIVKEGSKILRPDPSEDDYPIIWYEPDIDSLEKKALKTLIKKNYSIHLFSKFKQVLRFAKTLETGFLFIVSREVNENKLFENFEVLKELYGRRYFDFEEEAVLVSLFNEISEQRKESLKIYLFCTCEDFLAKTPINEEEEEVKVVYNLKEMAKQFQEEFIIFWCDPNLIVSERKEAFIKQFDIIEQNIFTDFDDLLKKLENYIGLPYHLILSGKTQTEKIVNKIDDFKDLLCLYIYDGLPLIVSQEKEQKIKIKKTLNELAPKIIEGLRTNSKLKNTFPVFSTELDDYDKNHINKVHHYLKGFIHFKNRRQAKGDFINLAQRVYQSDKLSRFEKEYNEYQKEQILKWYTIDSPVFKLLNNCLRIATSDSITYCRFILKDMERAIREEYQQQDKRYHGVVYRGAYISTEEFEKLENNVGKEIEMYGFLSTSKNLKTASRFLTSDTLNKALITIIIPTFPLPELDEQGFADVSQFSEFSKEEEIIFNVRSKFQVLEAGRIQLKNNNKWIECRHLTLIYGAQLLRKYITVEDPIISLELNFPLELRCRDCDCTSKNNLLAYTKTSEETQLICRECFITKDSVPKNILLLPIEEKVEDRISPLEVKGKFLEFGHQGKLAYEMVYQCNKCTRLGQKRFEKWINLKNGNVLVECLECFLKDKESKLD